MRTDWRVMGLAAVALLALGSVQGEPAQKKGPVKVFILAGQSNMDGQADIRTLDFLGEDPDPARAALLKTFKPDGKLMTRADVWVTSGGVSGNLGPGYGGRKNYDKLGSCIGPEYSFGYYMAEASANQVLLIKYAPGGQSLYTTAKGASSSCSARPLPRRCRISSGPNSRLDNPRKAAS